MCCPVRKGLRILLGGSASPPSSTPLLVSFSPCLCSACLVLPPLFLFPLHALLSNCRHFKLSWFYLRT